MDALRRVVRVLSASARGLPGGGKVSGAQLFVLRQIAHAPGLTVGDVAARTLARQSAVSEVVARLADAGLVTRSSSVEDGRQTLLSLTAKGRRAVAAAEPTAQERLADALQAMRPAERKALAELLERWLTAAGMTDVPATMFLENDPGGRGGS